MTTIQLLANKYWNMFQVKTRLNGDKFYCVKDKYDDVEDLKTLIRDAHGDMLPDDYKYEFIVNALEAIVEHEDFDDINLEPSFYTHELLKWLSSHIKRVALCDEVLNEFENREFISIISYAQQRERESILYSVKESLEKILENEENNDDYR